MRQLILRISDKVPMTEYMKRGNDTTDDEQNEWDESPFEKIDALRGIPSDHTTELENAQRIRQKVVSSGSISSDDAIPPAMAIHGNARSTAEERQKTIYYERAGPIAATAEGIRWNTAFTIDLSEAPAFKSDKWKAVASEFDVRASRRGWDLVPKKIAAAYKHLEEQTKANDGFRAMHPWELKHLSPHLPTNADRAVLDYLGEFPGVNPPATDGPAWVLESEETGAQTGSSEVNA